jgi:predicted GNAT family N-acyltransferase
MDCIVRFASTQEDRDAAFVLRHAVFEVEQGVPRPLDRDAYDLNAHHVVVFDGAGRCVGTGRVVRLSNRTCQIGRMAVASDLRRHGIGAAVLQFLERMASLRGVSDIIVHAQLPAEAFYAHRGYVTEGDVFHEQGVPHVLMRKSLMAQVAAEDVA